MRKNLISPYVGEALHTSSEYLLNKKFDLSFSSMVDNRTAEEVCRKREQEAYRYYIKKGPLTFENFMETLRNSFVNSNDAEVLNRFSHERLTAYLRTLANDHKDKRTEQLFQEYEFTIEIKDEASPEIEKVLQSAFPQQMKRQGFVSLNLGIANQEKQLKAMLKQLASQRKGSKNQSKGYKETLKDIESGLINGLVISPGKKYPTSMSTAIELDSKARSFPWGFYKADIEKALETQDPYYTGRLQEAYNALKTFFTKTLIEGGSPEMHRAAEMVWQDKLGNSLSSSFSFFEKGDVKNLQIGAAGEFQAALIFAYFDIIFGGNGKEIAKIAGDEMKHGVQGKIDVELLGKYGIQVKNYDLALRETLGRATVISTGTNAGRFSEYLDPKQGEDFRLFFANYYFNKSFADQRKEDFSLAVQNIGEYAYGLYSLAMSDSLEDDRVSFYLVGGKFLIPASDIIAAFRKNKKGSSIRRPDIAIRGINRLTDEEFEERGLEPLYWKQSSNVSYYPTELNEQQYENLLYRNINISSHINYMEIIGDLYNSKYALY